MRKFILFFSLMLAAAFVEAQQQRYVAPTDPLVIKNIAKWQDLKFGLFMHWGTYSQWGVVESWSICPEDEGWTQRKGPYSASYFDYKKAYENLQTTFNPHNFNPEKWVAAAKDAGMKYVVFTTKHHDGFCMFDTKQTDYKITDSKTPFSSNPRSNVAKEVFDAFRKENFMIGAYFSKPDWHTESYWWPYFPPKDRNVNYDPAKYPERWKKFKDFTYDQIEELMTGYGKMDILWLDGGWVRPKRTLSEEEQKTSFDQDIDMARIAAMGRRKQPGLIVVDRSVGGEFENYTTPEQEIPKEPLSHPWESCITMGNSWSYVPGDHYKSANEIVAMLVKIVSRGGNLLMNIGPGPDGDWDPVAYSRLKEVGAWIKINGEGIYQSASVAPYNEGNIYYTQTPATNTLYAFVLPEKNNESVTLPAQLIFHPGSNAKIKKVTLLGINQKIKWKQGQGAVTIDVPGSLRTSNVLKHAAVFKMEH